MMNMMQIQGRIDAEIKFLEDRLKEFDVCERYEDYVKYHEIKGALYEAKTIKKLLKGGKND